MESLTLSENSERDNKQQQEKNTNESKPITDQDVPFGFLPSNCVSPIEEKVVDQSLKSNEKLNKSKLIFHLYSQQSFTQETTEYLVLRQGSYSYNRDSIFTNQRFIKPFMREMLVDWIMEVSDEFKLKKQTFYLAVHFVDKYLQIKTNLKLEKFQLLGATALLIASKIEEIYCPRVKDFELATDSGFNEEQIIKMERKILTRVQWLANPTTINAWANCFMQKWDQYSQLNPLGLSILDPQYYQTKKIPMFKSDYNEDYLMFRVTMQALDFSVLDIEYMKHDPRFLAITSIVISLGLSLKTFNRHQIGELSSINRQNFIEMFLDDDHNEYSHMIIDYCENYCNIRISELKDTFKFICQFYFAETQLQLPSCLKDQNASTQEEFYSFQIHYRNIQDTLEMVRKLKHSVGPITI